ncbi:uncharacterized protein LTR77_008492 [Saxophila tyrrhenica]|uniref:PH domain-containing protein n=1 Tax=Saxophila tyrrhenica TaxID=1690608 RepID=A0AAV9P153_9PEZI|nr:hypothetical protein LTR77_008492 [Saxophila tyrrhenica]
MSRSSNDSSWGRRRSLLALPTLNSLGGGDGSKKEQRTLKKTPHRRAPSLFTELNHPDLANDTGDELRSAPAITDSPRFRRPSLSLRSSVRRPPSTPHNYLKTSGSRGSTDDTYDLKFGEPLSATPSSATSYGEWSMDGSSPARNVLLHGDVQTSGGVFRKKKEYLVLTETHIIRFKSQSKAADALAGVPHPTGRPQGAKHNQMPSSGSLTDLRAESDSSGDKDGRIALRQVVAVYQVDDGKPYFALDVCFLDEESAQSSALTMQFNAADERDLWVRNIRTAGNSARLRQPVQLSSFNVEHAARIIERDHDYDPANCAIYKVVQRQPLKSSRSSTDDLTKLGSTGSTVCFLVIGVHKVHIVQLIKPAANRSGSPSLQPISSQASFGILNLSAIRINDVDDGFELSFRQPLQPAKRLSLASLASHEIGARLHYVENYLRPEAGHRLFRFSIPPEVENLIAPPVRAEEEHSCFDRTLSAYSIAYGLNPANVRYTINYDCEDAPRFELLPPADTKRSDYRPLALLAIMRALRYNESFGSLSFAGINLDSLNGLDDEHGKEYVCTRTKRGTPIRLTEDELGRACVLVQEVRALAATSKRLRRMDFSGCVTPKTIALAQLPEEENPRTKDIGCGVVEALVPLCRQQTTNVDWICLNGIELSDTDMDYLVGAAVDKSCHFRAIELNKCGLNDRSMGLILDALRAQENTLEAIEIAGNTARIDPVTFDSQLGMFGFIRKLNLSHISRTSGNEPLLTAETLLVWRLQELRLSGTLLNSASIDAVATYLAHPHSMTLHELYFDNAYLTGGDIATILHSLSLDTGYPRDIHLDISHNILSKGLEKVTKAIADGLAPTRLSMRAIEYREESQFRKMLNALINNKSIQYLDMSQTALPGDASEETCRAMARLLAENDTLVELDLSGEDSRLASSKFGAGINDALVGLKRNTSLHTFRIERQKLGVQGANTLADVLKDNTTLRELHCDNNEIPLQGLTDLVNSLIDNTTLIYLPSMRDGREAAFKSAEATMKGMTDPESPPPVPHRNTASFGSASGMRRGLSTVRQKASRAASAYTPSFPALPSRTPDSPNSRQSFSLSLPTARSKQSTNAPIAAPAHFTVQDIQTTHRLLSEQWDRQHYRLSQYLERNWCLLNNMPVDMEVEDEKFERPASIASLGKVLELVKSDTTPRAEPDMYFTGDADADLDPMPQVPAVQPQQARKSSLMGEKTPSGMSFKQFILDGSAPGTPESLTEMEAAGRQLRVDTANLIDYEEPRTPTQAGFGN